jgi:hypothetical protein
MPRNFLRKHEEERLSSGARAAEAGADWTPIFDEIKTVRQKKKKPWKSRAFL